MQDTDSYLINRTFDEIKMGDTAAISHVLTIKDIEIFAVMSGDINPAHVDPEYAKTDMFHQILAHGMWGAALISTVLGTKLPGPGTIYLSQTLKFLSPVLVDDTVTATVTVLDKNSVKHHVELECVCVNQHDQKVIAGIAKVIAPIEKICRPRAHLPEIILKNPG